MSITKEEVKEDEIKLEAIIDFKRKMVFIKPNTGDYWNDWGLWLKVMGLMIIQTAKFRNWSWWRTCFYAFKYFRKCADDYKMK